MFAQAETVMLEGKLAESSKVAERLSNARAALELTISKAEDSGFALSQRKQALVMRPCLRLYLGSHQDLA